MAAPNTAPIYTRKANVSSDGTGTTSSAMAPTFTTAAADYDGSTATNNKIVFTADATNGGYLRRIRLTAKGTNVATVIRFYINNGGAATTAANNSPLGKLSLPATTASNTVAEVEADFPCEFALPPGFRILAGLGTTVAAGWTATPIGGDY